ncbi:MAG: cation-translocating P-type ATPase [Rhodospirillaceae bacterium]
MTDPAAAPARTVLAVSGMTCAACVSRLERVLGRWAGVVSVSVSLPAERAEIAFDPALTGLADLIDAVEGAGFGAKPAGESGGGDVAAEVRRTLITLIVSACLSLPLLAAMLIHIPGWLQWLLATPVQFWAGARFYRGAWHALKGGGANMDVLVALGTSAAYGLGVWQVLSGAHPQFEAAALVITLVIAGKGLEARARRETNQAIDSLAALRPPLAVRLGEDGGEESVAIERIRPGDRVRVRPGERIPVDGTVVEGRAAVDESVVTGEAMPCERGPGDSVTGGTLALDGALTIRTGAVGADAVLGRMIALIGHAQATKPRIQRLADRVSGLFAFFVAAAALATLAGWWLASGELATAILPAVAVLVVACPCALGLATPAVIAVALGVAARHGILIRDAEALEAACGLTTVIFDKTGTLTEDQPDLTDVEALGGGDDDLLALAAAVQRDSSHPIARAVARAVAVRGLAVATVSEFRTVPGRGVLGSVGGRELLLGNRALMEESGIAVRALAARAGTLEAAGRAVVWIGERGATPRLLGLLAIADRLRPGAAAALTALRSVGLEVLMLTGDAPAAAFATGARLRLAPGEVLAGVHPEGKIAEIVRRQARGERVAMVGDGINDGPALARADLGIAMGGGSDVAIHAAGVSLMRPEPELVAALHDLARAARRKIIQNLGWAFGFNLLAIPAAAFGVFGPVPAAVAMTVSSLGVVGNALALRHWRPRGGAGWR